MIVKLNILTSIENNLHLIFGSNKDEDGQWYSYIYKHELNNIANKIQEIIDSKKYTTNEITTILRYLFINCFDDCINHYPAYFEKIIKDYQNLTKF